MKALPSIFRATLIPILLFLSLMDVAFAAVSISPSSQSVTGYVGQPLTTRTLTPSGFTGTVSFTVTPALPSNLVLNGAGQISGTPSATQAATLYTITATDGKNKAAATATITIKPTIKPSSQSITGSIGTALATQALTTNGFIGTVSYAVTPTPSNNLGWNGGTGQISGTPSANQAATIYTITATDTSNNSATATVTITVKPSINPSSQSVTGNVGKVLATQALTANGFTGTVSYAVSPAPSNNLGWNGSTGQISGTPSAVQTNTKYTITASDGVSSATATVNITINPPPPVISPSTQLVVGTRNVAITPTTAFSATNFKGTVSYSISPALPNNLSINAGNGVISGTPSLPQSATLYTITAKDTANGTAKATVTITITDTCITETLTPAEEGRRAYLRMNCYSCHGTSGGGGMGPNIVGGEGDVAEAVPQGSDNGMPSFSSYLCGNDINNLKAYLMSIGTKSEPKFLHWWMNTPDDLP